MDTGRKKELSLSGQFYRMRDDWIRHIIRRPKDEFSHVEKLVAVLIAETINPESRSWVISQPAIAGELGVGIRVVKGTVSKLRNEGLIETSRVQIPGQVKLFNRYFLVPVHLAIPSKVHGGAPA